MTLEEQIQAIKQKIENFVPETVIQPTSKIGSRQQAALKSRMIQAQRNNSQKFSRLQNTLAELENIQAQTLTEQEQNGVIQGNKSNLTVPLLILGALFLL